MLARQALRSAARSKPLALAARWTHSGTVKRILVTGACGQIGSELIPHLRLQFGDASVVASDIKHPGSPIGKFVPLDVLDAKGIMRIILEEDIDTIVHLGAILSAFGEKHPALALEVNGRGTENVLEVARQHSLRVFVPSSIAAFGPDTPRDNTPDITIQRPTTMYGINKVTAELLGEYYALKFGVDFRSLRYPGIISNVTPPGGGTTDYAVEIFYEAIRHGRYTCFLRPDTRLPMMYMPDCLKATATLLSVPKESLKQCTYNVSAISFTPAELERAIKKIMPEFVMDYKPDFRQQIADSWPRSLDDSRARADWAWAHEFDLDSMCEDMFRHLRPRLEAEAQQS
mmetsp:Transcript_21980/g.70755  ORF Transcript_21980/g.70755 Transcript_21980/m.70755 type:complete len:344 (+) Transcript_21980:19-1050(+)